MERIRMPIMHQTKQNAVTSSKENNAKLIVGNHKKAVKPGFSDMQPIEGLPSKFSAFGEGNLI